MPGELTSSAPLVYGTAVLPLLTRLALRTVRVPSGVAGAKRGR